MLLFGKSFIKFCHSFINLTILVSILTFSFARVRICPYKQIKYAEICMKYAAMCCTKYAGICMKYANKKYA